ncbi:hypothetical protein [Pelagerythrobacter rhizovicinus]|uniref:hypothetical protein n=1 Tax=Pelagerythrobacter rhizovicinus TaxID=2268576 RepID=UPI00177C12D5|nr:hypothetical protein [Pelagerythrobacter rhizovicinus]
MMHKTIAVATLALFLAACDGGTSGDAAGEGAAEGEVLGGTISDEMLPLDTVRSQSPPLRTEPGEEGAAGDEATPEAEEAPDEQEQGGADQSDDDASVPDIRLDPEPEPVTPAPGEDDGE